jgi:hypothetical protein
MFVVRYAWLVIAHPFICSDHWGCKSNQKVTITAIVKVNASPGLNANQHCDADLRRLKVVDPSATYKVVFSTLPPTGSCPELRIQINLMMIPGS